MNHNHLRTPAAPVTPAQVTAIKMGKNALGIPDDIYYDTLQVRYGAQSCKDLTQEQASDLIEDYVRKGFVLIQPEWKQKRGTVKPKKHPRPAGRFPAHGLNTTRPVARDNDKVICLARADEIDKINAVAALIAWRVENGLALFLEKRMGIKGGKVRTAQEAYLAIEGLKKMFENGMKAKYGAGWWTMRFDAKINEYIHQHKPAEWR